MSSYVIRGGAAGKARLSVISHALETSTAALLDSAGVREGMRCLDLGCGGGDVTLALARLVGPSGEVVGIDMDTVKLAISRTDHIHTRVGHAEGPQVNDPRAPEWKDAVNAHFDWWDQVVGQKRSAGKLLTMLTEFGPVDYLPALPYTRQPVADQWEINKYMLDTLRTRYAK